MSSEENINQETATEIPDYSDFKEDGLEQAPVQQVPEFRIIQPQSVEIMDMDNDLFGCDPGLIYNRFSKETMSTLDFLPCYVRQMFSVYLGFKNTKREFLYSTFERPIGYAYDKDKGMFDESNHSFENSVVFLGLRVKDPNFYYPIFLKLSGTNRPIAMEWLKVMHASPEVRKGHEAYVPPAYSRIFTLESKLQKNEGLAWFIWVINPHFMWVKPQSEIFQTAQMAVIQLRKFFSNNLISQPVTPQLGVTADDIPF